MATHGFMPRHQPGDHESSEWNFPLNMEGQLFDSLEQLNASLPKEELWSQAYLRLTEKADFLTTGFDRYSRKLKGSEDVFMDVAYGCHGCNKIIVGPPRIESENSISPLHPLSGRVGYDMYCTNCGEHIYESTIMRS